ncbi:MAG: hypothetical protein JKY08_06210 [Flavobacteriaceae bacterium]|nr:hypothetical protein [Flavobacteriaceae bacterium]
MITIRTGGNGSYKSAYTVWFSILPALKAGRVVVTNIEGMETLEVIQERLQIEFPPTAKIIRIFSRDGDGVFLWQHFFCWCPLEALIVIDECQDLYSKNIGFDFRKVKSKPLSDFLEFLPSNYEDFFNSRHVPVDMNNLKSCEKDDTGKVEYDENGRIVYPNTFNEGFMRHRKYNWDIELLSPDWQQIDSSIKACAEQAFYQKSRDKFFIYKRKPYIFLHAVTCSKPSIPQKKNNNLFSQKIPIEVHLLYKSTGTGKATKSGGLNTLFKSPRVVIYMLIGFLSIGYFIYGVMDFLFKDESQVKQLEPKTEVIQSVKEATPVDKKNHESDNVLHSSGGSSQDSKQIHTDFVPVKQVLYFEGLERAYLGGFHRKIITVKRGDTEYKNSVLDVVINVYTNDGAYTINKKYLELVGVKFELVNECLLLLKYQEQKTILTCEPTQLKPLPGSTETALISSDAITENSIFL